MRGDSDGESDVSADLHRFVAEAILRRETTARPRRPRRLWSAAWADAAKGKWGSPTGT
jgi:hypothetical protein